MAHPWENLVVSGVDSPRILLVSDNFCSNPFLTLNSDGYTVSGAVITRAEDFSAYYEYMLSVNTNNINTDYVEYSYDYGSSVANKTFLIALNVFAQGEFKLVFKGDIEFGEVLFDSQIYKKAFIVATATGVTGNTISFRIYGARDMKFDNVYFAEVLYDLEMPQPHNAGELLFEKDADGIGELWSGKKKEYNVKWIPNYSANYFYLSEENEQFRQLISEYENVFCIPHLDYNWGFLGKWMKDEFERNYVFGEYVGHSGELSIKGQEYLNQELAIQLIIYYEVLITAFLP